MGQNQGDIPMKIKITQEHIDCSTVGAESYSPLCLACNKLWPKTRIAIIMGDLFLDGSPVEIPYLLDRWLGYYHAGTDVHPTEWYIKIPLWLRVKLWLKN